MSLILLAKSQVAKVYQKCWYSVVSVAAGNGELCGNPFRRREADRGELLLISLESARLQQQPTFPSSAVDTESNDTILDRKSDLGKLD